MIRLMEWRSGATGTKNGANAAGRKNLLPMNSRPIDGWTAGRGVFGQLLQGAVRNSHTRAYWLLPSNMSLTLP